MAADETAVITIMNGETEVTNGSSASWSAGENTLEITVTDGTDPQISKVYTVTVTRS